MSEQSRTGPEPQVVVTFDGGVALLTLNNPRRKNAITLGMCAAIEAFCDKCRGRCRDRRGACNGAARLLLQRGRHPRAGGVLGRPGQPGGCGSRLRPLSFLHPGRVAARSHWPWSRAARSARA